ncbi:hypothetical protein CDD81_6816 [Ophiocordyceps australis]|uniref:Uncharacterized protein n=1 Tax=Ophiocordyceps australis TaxID=1399860 RepID=A0A2C5Y5G1_9HYPO|nr:hypothetical protein CDD81_6816 [Ophiocordyceps australis]
MLLTCETVRKGSLFGLLAVPPLEKLGGTEKELAITGLSRAIVDAVPTMWLSSFKTAVGWGTADIINGTRLSIGILSKSRLEATIGWFRKIGDDRQRVCWWPDDDSIPEYHEDFFGYLSAIFLNNNSLDDEIPRRFKWLPPGPLSQRIPQVFDSLDYSKTGILGLLLKLIADYDSSWTENGWWKETNDALDLLGCRLGRTLFQTFLQKYPCPNNKCNQYATPGHAYYPPNPLSLLKFFVDRIEAGQPFVVTTHQLNVPMNTYWLHVQIGLDSQSQSLKRRSVDTNVPVGHQPTLEQRRAVQAHVAAGQRPPVLRRRGQANTGSSGPACILEFSGPIKLIYKHQVTHITSNVRVESWGRSLGVSLSKALDKGPINLQGPSIVTWIGHKMQIPEGTVFRLEDGLNNANRMLVANKRLEKSISDYVPATGSDSPPDGDEWSTNAWGAGSSNTGPGGAGGDAAPIGDGWAQTSWHPSSARKVPVPDPISWGPDGDPGLNGAGFDRTPGSRNLEGSYVQNFRDEPGPHGEGYMENKWKEVGRESVPKMSPSSVPEDIAAPLIEKLDFQTPPWLPRRPISNRRIEDCPWQRATRIATQNAGGDVFWPKPRGSTGEVEEEARNKFRCGTIFQDLNAAECPPQQTECAPAGVWQSALSAEGFLRSGERAPGWPLDICTDVGARPMPPPAPLLCLRWIPGQGNVAIWCSSVSGDVAMDCWGPDPSSLTGWYNKTA